MSEEDYLAKLKDEFRTYSLDTIRTNHQNLWDRKLKDDKILLENRYSGIYGSDKLIPVLNKIKSFKKTDNATHFIGNDNGDIGSFIKHINGNNKKESPGIHTNQWINNLPGNMDKKHIPYYEYMNTILCDEDYYHSIHYDLGKLGKTVYSIVKYLKEPNKYIMYYTYWENLMKFIFEVNSDDYKDYCLFYQNLGDIPPEDYPRETYFYVFMNCIGYLIARKTLSEQPQYTDFIINKFGPHMALIFKELDDDSGQPEQTNTNLSEQTSSDTQIKELPLNLILYGPPGTGKTYNTVNKALEIIDRSYSDNREENRKRFDELVKEGQIQFITFHQSMSYEDFIEGIKPETEAETKTETETVTEKKETGLKYQKVDGIFKKIALEAAKEENKSKNFVLIIDEINRGNIAEIFGELITLIEEDKRIGNAEAMYATLPYTHEKFGVPNNLYIIGTMNTADRSVESLDTALRRRFSFEEMMPNYDLLNVKLSDFLLKTDGTTVIENDSISGDTSLPDVTLGGMLEKINLRIRGLKDREHQIGHAYFMGYPEGTEERKEWLKNVFKNKVVPLLQEYFYGDFKQIAAVLGPSFVTTENYTSSVFVYTDDFEFDEVTKYDVLSKDGWDDLDICEALKKMALE